MNAAIASAVARYLRMKTIAEKVRVNYECDGNEYQAVGNQIDGTVTVKHLKRNRIRQYGRTNQFSAFDNCDSDSAVTNYMDELQVPTISCNYNGSKKRAAATKRDEDGRDEDDDDMDEEEGYRSDRDDEDDTQEAASQQEEHIFEPMSGEIGQTTRPCLAWACKACKKKSVAVDRRKAATLRERRRLRKVRVDTFMPRTDRIELMIT